MIEQRDPKSLLNERLAGIDHITIPVKDLEVAEQFYAGVLGGEVVFRGDSSWVTPGGQEPTPHISVIIGNSPKLNLFLQDCGQPLAHQGNPHIAFQVKGEDLIEWQIFLHSNGIPTDGPRRMGPPGQASLYFDDPFGNHLELCADVPNRSLNVNNASLVSYQQRWEGEIANRFREAKKRFPEFFPCFELLESPGTGLQYSIHFEPLTGHAKALTEQTPLFPHQKEFKPIEKLWHEDGSSELDILFERFPTQLALLPPKQPWGTRLWELLLGLVHQGMELKGTSGRC